MTVFSCCLCFISPHPSNYGVSRRFLIVVFICIVFLNKIGESGEGQESFEEKEASIGSSNSNEGLEDDSDDSPSPPAGTSSPTQINGKLSNMGLTICVSLTRIPYVFVC